jgi:hypothetical protein
LAEDVLLGSGDGGNAGGQSDDEQQVGDFYHETSPVKPLGLNERVLSAPTRASR